MFSISVLRRQLRTDEHSLAIGDYTRDLSCRYASFYSLRLSEGFYPITRMKDVNPRNETERCQRKKTDPRCAVRRSGDKAVSGRIKRHVQHLRKGSFTRHFSARSKILDETIFSLHVHTSKHIMWILPSKGPDRIAHNRKSNVESAMKNNERNRISYVQTHTKTTMLD